MDIFTHIPGRAMAVAAHPDDIELSAGGTLALWAAAGTEITAVIGTDGAAGSTQPGPAGFDIAERRRLEQEAAAAELGIHRLVWLGRPDGGLEDTLELRGELVHLIRRHRPETLLTHDPARYRQFLHRDHRIIGQLTLDAIYPYARDHLHFPEQLNHSVHPHKVVAALLWESDEANVMIDITAVFDQKVRALELHRSQLAGLLGSDDSADDLRTLLTNRARRATVGSSLDLAESFRLVQAPR